jgi:hypothetical protein
MTFSPLSSIEKTKAIKSFIFNCGSNIVSVEFIKKDGTKRCITFNPRDTKEIKGIGTNCTVPSIIRVRDFKLAKQGPGAWRSFDCDRVVKVKSMGEELSF